MILSLSRAWESTKAFEFLVLIIFSIVPISFHPLLFHRPLICVFISKLHTTYITYFENSFSDSIPHTLLHWWSNVLLMQLILQFCDFEILDALLCFFKVKKKINPNIRYSTSEILDHQIGWRLAEDTIQVYKMCSHLCEMYITKKVLSDGIYSIENAKIFIYTFRPVLLISHNICYVISDVNMSLICFCLFVKFVLTNKNVFFSPFKKSKQTSNRFMSEISQVLLLCQIM